MTDCCDEGAVCIISTGNISAQSLSSEKSITVQSLNTSFTGCGEFGFGYHSSHDLRQTPKVLHNAEERSVFCTPSPKTESPHFSRNPTNASVQASKSSRFFLRSTSSVYGSVQSLGQPILMWVPMEILEKVHTSPDGYCRRKNKSTKVCVPCQMVIRAAAKHFEQCECFEYDDKLTATGSRNKDVEGPCYEVVGRSIENGVRHLCSHQCYMKAYAPVRDWWLCRQFIATTRDDVRLDHALKDWTCILVERQTKICDDAVEDLKKPVLLPGDSSELLLESVPVTARRELFVKSIAESSVGRPDLDRSFLPRTVFVQKQGSKLFCNISALLKELSSSHPDAEAKQIPIGNAIADCTRPPKRAKVDRYLVKRPSLTRITEHTLPEGASPLGLLEELFCDKPWQLLLSAILLNRTRRIQVDRKLHLLLSLWPSPESILDMAASDLELKELKCIIGSLGIKNRRAKGIVRFSREYLSLVTDNIERLKVQLGERHVQKVARDHVECHLKRHEILSLYYCGEYCADAYQIFILKDWESISPKDHALEAYIEWKRSQETLSPSDKDDTSSGD